MSFKLKIHPFYRLFGMTLAIGLVKTGMHYIGFEPFSFGLSALFSSSLMGTIFLLGFILAGVLTDYKESERIPCEMVASLSSIWMEAQVLARVRGHDGPELLRQKLLAFIAMFRDDFLIKRQDGVFELLDSFSAVFAKLDEAIPPPFMARMRADLQNLRRLLSRIKTIRSTSFSEYGYVVIKFVIAFFILSMLLVKIDPFAEELFFLCFISFVLIGIFTLIRDMEDPFEYDYKRIGKDEVSFDSLFAFEKSISVEKLDA